MKVLLTGGNGFLGSHILELLLGMKTNVVLLLRPTGNIRFISRYLSKVHVHHGSLNDPATLQSAMQDVDAVIHCAGKTKALKSSEYDTVNYHGTQNIVSAVNSHRNSIKHLVHISSLAVSGPGDLHRPARETEKPRPVSTYGRSKLRGEKVVTHESRVSWTVLRPAAVYGPRDFDFFNIFRWVKKGIIPMVGGGGKPLSLVYVQDMARAVQCCLEQEAAFGKIYHVAADPPCSDEAMVHEIAGQMQIKPFCLNLPVATLYPICLIQEMISRITGQQNILNLQKIAELRASGWVCATERIRHDLGFEAAISLKQGVKQTLAWYRSQGWL